MMKLFKMENVEGKQLPKHILKDFLDLYRSFPCLWNPKDRSYVNRKARNEAYCVLVRKCQEAIPSADVEFVRKKINSYRSTFRKEYLKIKASEAKNDPDGVYEPSLWYFDLMKFLVEGRDLRQVKKEQEDSDIDQEIEEFEEEESSSHTMPEYEEMVASPGMYSTSQYLDEVPAPSKPRARKRARRHLDQNDLFGQLVAAKLRTMDLQQRIFAEKVISDSLFLGQMGYLTSSVFTEPTLGFPLPGASSETASP